MQTSSCVNWPPTSPVKCCNIKEFKLFGIKEGNTCDNNSVRELSFSFDEGVMKMLQATECFRDKQWGHKNKNMLGWLRILFTQIYIASIASKFNISALRFLNTEEHQALYKSHTHPSHTPHPYTPPPHTHTHIPPPTHTNINF